MMKYPLMLVVLFCSISFAFALSAQSGATTPSTRRATNLPKVDLNTGAETALASLPGVGDALANKIIASRPYASVDELTKAGVSATKIEQLRPFVTVANPTPVTHAAEPSPGALAGAGMKPVPVESGIVRTIPVPAGTVKTMPVPSGTVQAAPAGRGPVSVAPGDAHQRATSSDADAKSSADAARLSPGLVWVDKTKKVFYRQGSPSYGKSEPGLFMTEVAALAAGYHEERKAAVKKAPAKKKPS